MRSGPWLALAEILMGRRPCCLALFFIPDCCVKRCQVLLAYANRHLDFGGLAHGPGFARWAARSRFALHVAEWTFECESDAAWRPTVDGSIRDVGPFDGGTFPVVTTTPPQGPTPLCRMAQPRRPRTVPWHPAGWRGQGAGICRCATAAPPFGPPSVISLPLAMASRLSVRNPELRPAFRSRLADAG